MKCTINHISQALNLADAFNAYWLFNTKCPHPVRNYSFTPVWQELFLQKHWQELRETQGRKNTYIDHIRHPRTSSDKIYGISCFADALDMAVVWVNWNWDRQTYGRYHINWMFDGTELFSYKTSDKKEHRARITDNQAYWLEKEIQAQLLYRFDKYDDKAERKVLQHILSKMK